MAARGAADQEDPAELAGFTIESGQQEALLQLLRNNGGQPGLQYSISPLSSPYSHQTEPRTPR